MGGEGNAALLLLGLDNAGKTTFLRNYMHDRDVALFHVATGISGKISTWKGVPVTSFDVGGRCLRPALKRQQTSEQVSHVRALVWMVDASDRRRIAESREELQWFLEECDRHRSVKLPLVLVSNKTDLLCSRTKEEIEELMEVNDLRRDRTVHGLECSAKTGAGVPGVLALLDELVAAAAKEPSFVELVGNEVAAIVQKVVVGA